MEYLIVGKRYKICWVIADCSPLDGWALCRILLQVTNINLSKIGKIKQKSLRMTFPDWARVPGDFWPKVFSSTGPDKSPSPFFEKKIVKLFAMQGAPPVSTAAAANWPSDSFTPVSNFTAGVNETIGNWPHLYRDLHWSQGQDYLRFKLNI